MKRIGILAGISVVVAFGGMTLPGAEGSPSSPKAATLAFVDKAKLPIAREVVQAFRQAPRARRTVRRHATQMGGFTHRNVTNISVVLPARIEFRKGRRGTYEYSADFRGRIKPKNLVTVSINSYPDYPVQDGSYLFMLGRTERDGATSATPMHWILSSTTVHGRKYLSHVSDSCSIVGGRGGYHPILSRSLLKVGLRQARTVLRRAVMRRPIIRLRDVLGPMKPARKCP